MEKERIINTPAWLRKIIHMNGDEIYIVGGYVRNALCGLPPSDIDIAGKFMPDELTLPRGFFCACKYKRMGTALIKHRRVSGLEAEYTPFRTERYAEGGGHTPESVTFGASVHEDAMRRDFTVNSIYYDIGNERLIDFFGGVEDVKKKVLRAHDPEAVFSSDALRLLRLVRIAAETGFQIDEHTGFVAKSKAHLLADITKPRIRDELMKILYADLKYGVRDAHYRGLCLLREYGFLKYVIPELVELDGLEQPARYHKYDALEHTFNVVRNAPRNVRLPALLHDIGKARCIKEYGNMHRHAEVGAEMVETIMGEEGLNFSGREIERVTRLVRYHMYDADRKTRSGKMLLFVAREFDILDDLSLLMKADYAGKGTGETYEEDRLNVFKKLLIESGAPLSLRDLKINGADLNALGYVGEEIKDKLNELFEKCVLNPLLNKHESLVRLAKKE